MHSRTAPTREEFSEPVLLGAPFARIDHVQLAIPEGGEDRARSFYADILGFAEVPKPPELAKRGGVWFRCGVVSIRLGIDADFRPAKKAHPAFRCTDYSEFLERLRSRSVAIVVDDNPF